MIKFRKTQFPSRAGVVGASLLLLGTTLGVAAPGEIDPGFKTQLLPDQTPNSLVVQSDGKLIVGSGRARSVLRLDIDGTFDDSFSATNLPIAGGYELCLTEDEKILVNGVSTLDFRTHRILRLEADGGIDPTFLPRFESRSESPSRMLPHPDGSITYFADIMEDGTSRFSYIRRIKADGGQTAGFAEIAIQDVETLHLLPDLTFYAAGHFGSVNGNSISNIVHIGRSGELIEMAALQLKAPAPYVAVIYSLQTDRLGRIIIGGVFNEVNGQQRHGVARLESDGTLDLSFVPPLMDEVPGTVNTVVALADDKVLILGSFTHLNHFYRPGIARLHADGSLDEGFAIDSEAYRMLTPAVARTEGECFVAASNSGSGLPATNFVLKLRAGDYGSKAPEFASMPPKVTGVLSGSREFGGSVRSVGPTSFQWLGPGASVTELHILPDGTVLATGCSDRICTNRIWRLTRDGRVDEEFQALQLTFFLSGPTLAIQPDGRIWVGGADTHSHLRRLLPNGSLDPEFVPLERLPFSGSVPLCLSGGSSLVGLGIPHLPSVTYSTILEIGSDGAISTNILRGTIGVTSVAEYSPNQALIGGGNVILRIQVPFSVDTNFVCRLDQPPLAMCVQPDGNILIGGDFTRVSGVSRRRIARIFGRDQAPRPFLFGPVLTTVGREFEIPTINGRRYELQISGDLTHWRSLETRVGDGAYVTITDSSSVEAAQFYRVRVE